MPPHRRRYQIGTKGHDLAGAAQARRAHSGPRGERLERIRGHVIPGDEGIAGIFPGADDGKAKAFGKGHGHILHGVDRQISSAIEHGRFKLLNEEPLAANLSEGRRQKAVPFRGHFEQRDI